MPDYESNVLTLTLGGRSMLWERLDFGLSGSFNWLEARAGNGNTGTRIDGANRIDGRIIIVESDIDYPLTDAIAVGLGYRLQNYLDEQQLDPLDLDQTIHTVTLRVRFDLSLLQ